MKKLIEKIHEVLDSEDNSTKKTLAFFGFYFVFFLILILVIIFAGKDDYLLQEYEKGNTSSIPEGHYVGNFLFDYKITIDGVLYDYYGKKYDDVESFKYNNLDYYREKDEFFVNNNGTWEKCDNPYKYNELLSFDSVSLMLQNATLMGKEDKSDNPTYHFMISSNTINQVIYKNNTDYDEEPDTVDMYTDKGDYITKLVFKLNHFCSHRDDCKENLTIEMNYEMFGEVQKIDNPMK